MTKMGEEEVKIVQNRSYEQNGKKNTYHSGKEKETPDSTKLLRRSVSLQKSPKPTVEIYRPPSKYLGVRMTSDFTQNMKHVQPNHYPNNNSIMFNASNYPLQIEQQQNEPPMLTRMGSSSKLYYQGSNKSNAQELKSSLKRSKSFGAPDKMEAIAAGFENDHFPAEYHGLLKKVLQDPNNLSSRQLMEVVRVICNKAVENGQNAEPAAKMCLLIIEREKGKTFLESLLNSCREWFNEREKLLRSPASGISSGVMGGFPGTMMGVSRRWTAYVSFLTELYLRLKSRYGRSVISGGATTTHGSDEGTRVQSVDNTITLQILLFECCQIILKPPSINNAGEIECLYSMLTTLGRQLQKDSPQRMEQLMATIRNAFVSPSIPPQVRKTLLELVELYASNWHMDLAQSMYYFPYTSMERKGPGHG